MPSLFDQPARDPRYPNAALRRPVSPILLILCIAFAAAWIAAYAALLPLGEWRADEYDTFVLFREEGLGYLWHRTVSWSFRPLSELLLFVYAQAAHVAQRPLILPFLALLWAGLLISAVAPVFARRAKGVQTLLGLSLSLTLLALFLGGRRVDEVFYWTQGAVAYVPTIAAITFLVLSNLFAAGDDLSRLRLASAVAGTVAALSSEVGATFAAAYGAASLAGTIGGRIAARTGPLVRRCDAEFLPPLVAGVGVLLVLASGRLGTKLETFGDKAVAHRPLLGLEAALDAFPHEILSAPKGAPLLSVLGSGTFILPLLAVGAYGVFRAIPRSGAAEMPVRVAAIALALIGAAFLSLFAGFYQFGADCCSRHSATRYPMIALAVVCLAFLAAGRPPRARKSSSGTRWTGAAPLALMAAAALNGAQTVEALTDDFRTYGARWGRTSENWDAGLAPGSAMRFEPATGRFICWQHMLTDGDYGSGPETPPNVGYIGRYFGKSAVGVTGAGPTPSPCPPV